MTRKNCEHALQVINLLKFRNALDDFDITIIENKTEQEVAEIMQESLIYLSFGYPEGFSLSIAEAMSCGCIVIGYHGNGGKELMNPKFTYPIEMGYIIDFAKTVEKVLKQYNDNPENILLKGKKASEFICKNYSPEIEEKEVVDIWRRITNT